MKINEILNENDNVEETEGTKVERKKSDVQPGWTHDVPEDKMPLSSGGRGMRRYKREMSKWRSKSNMFSVDDLDKHEKEHPADERVVNRTKNKKDEK